MSDDSVQRAPLTAEPLVNRKDAATAIGVHERTLWKWLQRKRPPFPYYWIGGRLKFKLSDINRFVERRRIA